MYAALTCLQQHDPRLVILAAAICVVACSAGVEAYRRAAHGAAGYRTLWVLVMAVLLGSGVWATHFMAMLAYQRELQVSFGVPLTAASLLVAIGGLGIGARVALSASLPARQALGGAVCAAALAAMHYIGVSAMWLPARLEWNLSLVGASLAVGAGGMMAALIAIGDGRKLWRLAAGTGLMVLAICGLHFTAMGAVTLHPIPADPVPGLYGRDTLTWVVAGLVALILTSGAGMLLLDRVSRRSVYAALDASFAHVPTGIGAFDSRRRLIFWNRTYAALLATYGVEVRRGLDFDLILERAQSGEESDRPKISVANFGVESIRIDQLQRPDGRWMQVDMTPTGEGGFVVVASDITDHLEARRLAEEASRAKSEFLANMSHEIRTPLNAVLGMAQVMGREPLEPRQRQRLEVISESGRALLSTLNAVLDLTKIEAGKVELESSDFMLEEVVHRAAATYAPLAAQKDVRFVLDLAPDAGGAWRGDSTRLRQVLGNLLSNALKFTEVGEIRLSTTLAPEGVRFEVTDTGVGIPDHKLETIFEKFTQADNSTTRRYGGTGLGLAICREFVALMGGRWDVSSTPGRGSSFAFVLPLARSETAMSLAGEGAEAAAERSLRLLAAEDNPTNQLILSALLEPLDVELRLVGDGQAAVEAFRAERFDVILMDVQMPVLNGVEATREIRRHEAAQGLARTPILALTANVMSHQVEDYVAAGMDGVVGKPIEAARLLAAIEAVLGGGEPDAVAA